MAALDALPLNGPWQWRCIQMNGIRPSVWVLKDKDGNNVIEETKGIELVKRDAYVRAIGRAPELVAALHVNMALLENIASIYGDVSGALGEAISNTQRLIKGLIP
ncbi:hypothetical protein PLUTO_00650 [Luteibacter phage vB_LflM-Pluto]|uniref:Uncharacterized protein n=1 Tax=Luteibacter phage vB_LflM-Pluto TaxID=2948611 RepID=A0A9E7MT37_9CAUD|nr:hypothetical protein PLUTO_00650 [Luteibacter phage vB_LflM-Pluto]